MLLVECRCDSSGTIIRNAVPVGEFGQKHTDYPTRGRQKGMATGLFKLEDDPKVLRSDVDRCGIAGCRRIAMQHRHGCLVARLVEGVSRITAPRSGEVILETSRGSSHLECVNAIADRE
jgi:hypothetical protein